MDAMFFIVLGATLASFLLTLLFGRFVIPMLCALHAGQSIREVGPQWHNTKAGTPTMGGIMFIAAIILCTVGFGWKSMTENRDYTHLYVLALALCYGLVGFADDFVKVKLKRNLGLTAIQKFLLQLVVAVVFLFVLKNSGDLSCDLYIPFWNLDLEIPTAVYMVFAAFVIVGCVNAVNLTDGVDGLSSSVTIPVMVFFATTSYIYGRTTLALLPATVAGGLAGFLCYNFHPAKVFMGDTGSLLLGYVLSTVSVLGLFKFYAIVTFVVPVLALAVPLSDTLFAFCRRILHGQSPFHADRGHFHHKLMDLGLNQKQAVAILYAISATLGLAAVVLTTKGTIRIALLILALLIGFVVCAFIRKSVHKHHLDVELQEAKAAAEAETAAAAENTAPVQEGNDEQTH